MTTRFTGLLLGTALAAVLSPFAAADEPPPRAIADVARDLSAPDLDRRRRAAWRLWQRREEAGSVATLLAAAVRDPDAYVRETSARAVERHLPLHPAAVAALAGALSDERAETRRVAVRLLAWAGQQVVPAREALVRALSDADEEVRAGAAATLGRLAPEQRAPASAALRHAACDPSPAVRSAAVAALVALGDADATSVAARATRDPEPAVRASALRALARAPNPLRADLAHVTAMVADEDQDVEVRRQACFLLGRYPPGTDEVLDALVGALADADAGVRIAAAVALEKLPTDDPTVLEALGSALADESPWVVRYAARALAGSGPAAASHVPALLRVLAAHANAPTRTVAAQAVGRILGPLAEASRRQLRAALSGGDLPAVAAAIALQRIDPADGSARACVETALADPARAPAARTLLRDLPPGGLPEDQPPPLPGGPARPR